MLTNQPRNIVLLSGELGSEKESLNDKYPAFGEAWWSGGVTMLQRSVLVVSVVAIDGMYSRLSAFG